MKIKILYEDPNILVIDKPSGVSVHPASSEASPDKQRNDTNSAIAEFVSLKKETISDWVLKNYPKTKNVGEPLGEIKRPGVVHRLDHETSGVMLLVKNQKAFEFLKSQFSAPALEMQNRGLADRVNRVKKIYVAIVQGHVKNNRGVINKPIGRSPKDFRRHLAGRGARGELREAITEYKVLRRFKVKAYQNFYPRGSHAVLSEGRRGKNYDMPKLSPFSFLEIKPKTGRTHQIRVHMKFLNHPIVCDSLYNPKGLCPKGLSRLALHAKAIEFKNLKGKIIKVESPTPKIFLKLVNLAG